jgi:hypothetical protein
MGVTCHSQTFNNRVEGVLQISSQIGALRTRKINGILNRVSLLEFAWLAIYLMKFGRVPSRNSEVSG